jgi:hypothetical protein
MLLGVLCSFRCIASDVTSAAGVCMATGGSGSKGQVQAREADIVPLRIHACKTLNQSEPNPITWVMVLRVK